MGGGGDALYRSLVLADGAIAVTVELHSPGAPEPRTIHRGRCGLPPDPERTAERVGLLLAVADKAVARAVEADPGGAAGWRASPSSRRVPDPSPDGRRDGVSAARHERADRARGHARRDASTAA